MPFDNKTMSMVRTRNSVRSEGDVNLEPDLAEIVADLSVAEVIELIESGQAEIADVIAAEKVGKARKTVLALVQGESGKVYPVTKTDRSDVTTESKQNPFAERD